MTNDAFYFLSDEFPDIHDLCRNCEIAIVDERYGDAGNNGRKALEKILKRIIDFEGTKVFGNVKITSGFDAEGKGPKELINYLSRERKIDKKINILCNELRILGNNASHDSNVEFTAEDAKTVHELLYKLSRYFYRRYSVDRKEVNIYPGVIYKKDSKDEPKIIDTKSTLENYQFNQISGSYLLGELTKLKDSSHEAVEGYESLSDFKKYMHIDRSIQTELINKLKEISIKPNNSLVLLCGSVGDGKSHLLAYLNENESELMNNFKLWNDATESDNPNESCIDTLARRLTSFDDNHIDNSTEKLIISINLGVLNNFIDSEYAKERYSKLSTILNELNIFDVNDFSMNFDKEPVSIISFSDYNLFEFDEKNVIVSSNYLSDMFKKITANKIDNPFYNAYLKDMSNNLNSPIIYNYELFSQKNVQEIIITNLIKIIIKYKKIISTRELLNFIYEILVPSNIEEYDDNVTVMNYIDLLLPNLFFNSTNRCNILEIMHIEDPILKRNKITDEILMKLNVSADVPEVLSYYMDVKSIDFLMKAFGSHYNIRDLDNEDKMVIISSLIRFLNIFGNKEIKDLFTKKSYLDYVNYLYYYNKGNSNELRDLYNEIESAIYKWKGKLENKNLCIDQIDNFKISKQFNLSPISINKSIIDERNYNRFKTVIELEFSVLENKNETIILNLDYSLYEVITKLNKGYKPNKMEQKDLLLFNDFIDNLINLNTSKQFLINNTNDDINFEFELDNFGQYIFRRV